MASGGENQPYIPGAEVAGRASNGSTLTRVQGPAYICGGNRDGDVSWGWLVADQLLSRCRVGSSRPRSRRFYDLLGTVHHRRLF